MSLLIKIQVWRGDTLISEDACPVYPETGFSRSFGPMGTEPIIDGNIALRGFRLEQDSVFSTGESQVHAYADPLLDEIKALQIEINAQVRKNTEQRTEVERLKENGPIMIRGQCGDGSARLGAEPLTEDARDAARYRWLRDSPDSPIVSQAQATDKMVDRAIGEQGSKP